MSCQHAGCSLEIFTTCPNHCTQNLCLAHVIEHGDIFVRDFTKTLDHLDKTTCTLIEEANIAATELTKRRQHELESVNRQYEDRQQILRQQVAFAENATRLLEHKGDKLRRSKQEMACYVGQHDFEQIKIYISQLNTYLLGKPIKEEIDDEMEEEEEEQAEDELEDEDEQEQAHDDDDDYNEEEEGEDEDFPITNSQRVDETTVSVCSSSRNYPCPLTRPNVFGIRVEHDLRCDCAGSLFPKYTLQKHFEYYHRMVPEYALRLREAIVNGQSPEETELFSAHEVLRNAHYFIDCPLTDETNVFGARTALDTLRYFPCTRKKLTFPALTNHFHQYHKMTAEASRKLINAMKNKPLSPDQILFEPNECIGTHIANK